MTLARQVINIDSPGAHVDEVGDVVDVVFAYSRVGGCQIQQVVVPGLGALQLVLRILCLPLEEGKNGCESKATDGRDLGFSTWPVSAFSLFILLLLGYSGSHWPLGNTWKICSLPGAN